MRRITKWIIFIPAFIIGYVLCNTIALFSIIFLHNLIFPIKGFISFIFAGLGIALMIAIPMFFIGVLANGITIGCSNPKICKIRARVLFVIIVPLMILGYINRDYSTLESSIGTILDIVTFLVLIVFSIKDQIKENHIESY